MTEDFNQWWDESPVKANNPYTENTPVYWAWEGWCAGVEAERSACVQIVENEAFQYTSPVWAFEIVNDIKARGQA
jgi:hypothetical protein